MTILLDIVFILLFVLTLLLFVVVPLKRYLRQHNELQSRKYSRKRHDVPEKSKVSRPSGNFKKVERFLFSEEDLKKLSQDGFAFYQRANQTQDSDDWCNAAGKYDCTYTGLWGDVLFSGIKVGTEQFELSGVTYGLGSLSQEDQKKYFEAALPVVRQSFIVSCEFYLKAIEINPNNFFANLKLATALTAALKIIPSCGYWRKSLQLDQPSAVRALSADSEAKFHRGTATQLVILALDGKQSIFNQTLQMLQSDLTFCEQVRLAKDLLESSPYVKSRIVNF